MIRFRKSVEGEVLRPGFSFTWEAGPAVYYAGGDWYRRHYWMLRWSNKQRRFFFRKESWILDDDIQAFLFSRGYTRTLDFVNSLTEQIRVPKPPALKPKGESDVQS